MHITYLGEFKKVRCREWLPEVESDRVLKRDGPDHERAQQLRHVRVELRGALGDASSRHGRNTGKYMNSELIDAGIE
jgi:hypothetical protein